MLIFGAARQEQQQMLGFVPAKRRYHQSTLCRVGSDERARRPLDNERKKLKQAPKQVPYGVLKQREPASFFLGLRT
jgi:hypothetical protein